MPITVLINLIDDCQETKSCGGALAGGISVCFPLPETGASDFDRTATSIGNHRDIVNGFPGALTFNDSVTTVTPIVAIVMNRD
jgi:hypothetical protein